MTDGPRIGALFAGYGGLEMAVQSVVGGHPAWMSEIDPGACKILDARFPGVPNLGDITAIDWTQVDPVDVITGGSPCQDVSQAGQRKGMRPGTRSGLWASMCDAIDILRPALVVWENVRGVLSAGADSAVEPCPVCVGDERESHLRALGRVTGDLSELGYDARWVALPASDVGAPHRRTRVFLAARPAEDANGATRSEWRVAAPGQDRAPVGDSDRAGLEGRGPNASGRGERGAGPAGVGAGSGASPADAQGGRRERFGRIGSVERDPDGRGGPDVAWGVYEPAIRRWEAVLGRPAPATN